MPDSKVSALSEISLPNLEDLAYTVDDPSGTPTQNKVTWARLFGTLFAATCEGRLTTETGVPVSTSDRTSQGTLYFTPYNGNRVALYDGTRWKMFAFTERSLSLSVTSGNNYDIFLYDNAGTLTLEPSAAWTNDTTRADALTTQDGIFVKSGTTTRRWIGTIRASGSNVTEDSLAKRFVWNNYNRVRRPLKVFESTDSWNYSTATFRQMNGSSANQIDYVTGVADMCVDVTTLVSLAATASGAGGFFGVGVDATNTPSGSMFGLYVNTGGVANSLITTLMAHYIGYPGLGRHFLCPVEAGTGTVTTTWYGDQDANRQSGIFGSIFG